MRLKSTSPKAPLGWQSFGPFYEILYSSQRIWKKSNMPSSIIDCTAVTRVSPTSLKSSVRDCAWLIYLRSVWEAWKITCHPLSSSWQSSQWPPEQELEVKDECVNTHPWESTHISRKIRMYDLQVKQFYLILLKNRNPSQHLALHLQGNFYRSNFCLGVSNFMYPSSSVHTLLFLPSW